MTQSHVCVQRWPFAYFVCAAKAPTLASLFSGRLNNQSTGDKYHYTLSGTSEDPLAENHIVLKCTARTAEIVTFPVFNLSPGMKEEVTLAVESDLLHVSGPPSITLPPAKETKRGSAPTVEYFDYKLTVNPQMGGSLQGSITFTSPEGRYLWYTIELDVAPPASESTLNIRAPLRKVVSVEIPISNPASYDLEFAVHFEGEVGSGI